MIEIRLSERDFDYEIQALTGGFFPGQICRIQIEGEEEEKGVEEPDVYVSVTMKQALIQCCVKGRNGQQVCGQTEVSGEQDFHKHAGKTAHPYRTYYKNKLKSLIFRQIRDFIEAGYAETVSHTIPVWGTMTGVRPTKIPMNLLLDGVPYEQVCQQLQEEYQCSGQKAELCMQIAAKEAGLLEQTDYQNAYSLYIGIPFCPTTCMYCSFTSYPLERFASLVPDYLEALKKEIRYCGQQFQGQKLSSVYIGGGTPTTLSAEQLQDLIGCLYQNFPVETAYEFTVEAGRPDSITPEKLRVLKEAGVGRISVNPQTMQDKTLERIGRRHTTEQTRQVFEMAREAGFDNINMDLIIGLPGESEADFADTLQQIESLEPDSITIHSLVVKRASRLRQVMEECGDILEEERAARMENMLALGEQFAAKHQYEPYYMYRQKNSAGHAGSSGQENIGYARPGKECLYNILIMEEKQTILALGAGASTKRYDAQKNLVSRVENVKSVTDYINRIDEMLERKRDGRLFGRAGHGE